MPRLLTAALLCGATPLIFGIGIYTSWRHSRAEWLMAAGLVNIVIGLVMFVGGVICLSLRSTSATIAEADVRRRISNYRKLAWALLMVNFPAALLIALSAINVVTRYTVTVVNESSQPIQSFLLKGPGVRIEIGAVSPHREVQRHLRFVGDGSLDFEARSDRSTTNGVIDDYVTGSLGGARTVRIKHDGSVTVE